MGRIISAAARFRKRLSASPPEARPFRPFFLIAAFDALAGMAFRLPFMGDAAETAGVSAADWHLNFLLFAFVPAMLSGFVLTALPRWTKLPLPPHAVRAVLALSLSARACFLLLLPVAGLAVASLAILALALVAAAQVVASRDGRNLKLVLLLFVLAASAAASAFAPGPALRAALASVVGLMLIVSGRVVPALTVSFVEHAGRKIEIRRSQPIEQAAAIAATAALAGWVVAPHSPFVALAAILAAAGQALRLAQWCGWRVGAPSVLALHVGYGWIVTGFALLAGHLLAPGAVARGAFIHAWAAGAIGTTGLAIMASMIRRHSRRPFARSLPLTASFAAISLSAVSRLLAEPTRPEFWIPLSATAWVLAFVLFLVAFGRMSRA